MRNSNIASTALLYQNRTELEQFIQEYCLPARREDSSWLVMIHTSCHTPEGAVAIAKHVSELLPDAKILGTSASAVIYHGSIYEDGCLLIFTRLLHTQVKVQPLSFADKTPGALAEETAGLLTPDSKAMFAFFTDQYMQMQPYLDRLEETGADIPAAGGMITNNLYGTFAFDENGIYHNTALLAILNNEQLRTWSGAVTGLETFGGTHRITKSNHDYIAEIEQQPAVQWFQKMLRELRHAKDDGLSEDLLLHFPLRLQKPGNPGQFIHYCEPRDRIETYSNWLPPGTEFQMAYLSPMTAAAELQKQCSELETTPCEVISAYLEHFIALPCKTAQNGNCVSFAAAASAAHSSTEKSAERHSTTRYMWVRTRCSDSPHPTTHIFPLTGLPWRICKRWMQTGTTSINIWNICVRKQICPRSQSRFSCRRHFCKAICSSTKKWSWIIS